MPDFFTQVEQLIERYALVPDHAVIITGFSGGADSLALLTLLSRLRERRPFRLVAAHLNHGLRGQDAKEDERFAVGYCRDLGVHCHVKRESVRLRAEKQKISLEAAGRDARMAFFQEVAQSYKVSADGRQPIVRIALAHHQDDQAETLLLHLGRGCGLDGLTGMQPLQNNLIRPLLQQSRRDIEDWLQAQSLDWREDQSNQEPDVLRNRLRLQVLPVWRQALGYDPAPLLSRTARLVSDDQHLLEQLTVCRYQDLSVPGGVDLQRFRALESALQRRILRLHWQRETGDGKDLSLVHVENLIQWLAAARPGQRMMLPRGRQMQVTAGGLIRLIREDSRAGAEAEPENFRALPQTGLPLALPGLTMAPQVNLQIEALLIENESEIVYNDSMECFRLDKIRGCVLRHRQPGDRIHPASRQGGKRLKKYLNEIKVPIPDRDNLPLLAVGSDVIWIPGYTSNSHYIARPGDGQAGPVICLAVRKTTRDRVMEQEDKD